MRRMRRSRRRGSTSPGRTPVERCWSRLVSWSRDDRPDTTAGGARNAARGRAARSDRRALPPPADGGDPRAHTVVAARLDLPPAGGVDGAAALDRVVARGDGAVGALRRAARLG